MSVLRLPVQVSPNARQSEVAGEVEGVLRIRLQAQPVEGRANQALIRFLADRLGLPKSAVAVVQGASSRRKTVELRFAQDISLAEVKARLSATDQA